MSTTITTLKSTLAINSFQIRYSSIMKRAISIFIIFFGIIGAITSWSQSLNKFYVSTEGSDDNNGLIENPFRTIEKAKEAVRLLLAGNPKQNITVYLRGGNYFVEKTIRFNEQDGSTNGTIKYSGYKKEKAIIHGGIPIKGWEKWKNNVYRAELPQQLKGKIFYRLFDNSQSAVLARHPNVGDGFGCGLKRINNTSIKVPDEWRNYDFSKAQINGWIGSNWFAELRAAKSFNKTDGILKIEAGSNNFGGLNQRIYIQGVPELLDVENEWCIMGDSIYYYPSDHSDINKRLILVPLNERVIEFKGSTPGQMVENISFEILFFRGSDFTNSWEIFKKNLDGSMPEHLQEGLIYIENAKNISVKYCEIKGAGHSAVYINNKSEACTVYGCSISDAGFCGIYMNSYFPGQGNFEKPIDSYINKGHNISNNFIHHCGFSIGGGCGIQFFQSGDNRIAHNVICEMPRYGISYKGVRNGVLVETMEGEGINYENHFDLIHTRNNYIAYNEIFNVCRTSFDFGAIESWGAGKNNVWDGNAIHDIDQTVDWDGWAHGLFTDDASDFVTLKNNIVFELKGGRATGTVMVKSVEEIVANNIFADNAIGRVATMSPYAEPAKNNVVNNNIFFRSGEMLYDVDKNSFGKNFYGFYENNFNKEYVKNEKVFDVVDSNLIYPDYVQLDSLRKYGWDTHSVVADPLFDKKHEQWDVDYSDYILKPESPAYKTGFVKINTDSIGLLNDFPFDRKLIKNAGLTIQAEDYNRMYGLRPIGSTGIYKMQKGAWAKYDNVDFGNLSYNKFTYQSEEFKMSNSHERLFEIRLDAPNGKLIGVVNKGDRQVNIKRIKGIHNLFLVFKQEIILNNFRFVE